MNIQHSSRTDAWGSPALVIEKARNVLGRIDLDPASDWRFNLNVRASVFIDAEQNGLTSAWPPNCRVFINPPGGKTKNKSNTALFWERLMQYRAAGQLRQAVFLAFSLEALQTTQASSIPMCAFAVCVPRKRIAFETPEGVVGDAPSHSNAIVYVPGSEDRTQEFVRQFSDVGYVMRGGSP